jgi:hypothetical protein
MAQVIDVRSDTLNIDYIRFSDTGLLDVEGGNVRVKQGSAAVYAIGSYDDIDNIIKALTVAKRIYKE